MEKSESGSVSGLYESVVDMVSAFNEVAKGASSSYADRIVDSLSAFRDVVVKGGKVVC